MQNPELKSGREESHELPHREIDRCDIGTEQNHGDHDHDGGINELLVFFSILAGLTAFGFWGMVLGPAITAFFMALLKLYEVREENYFSSKE